MLLSQKATNPAQINYLQLCHLQTSISLFEITQIKNKTVDKSIKRLNFLIYDCWLQSAHGIIRNILCMAARIKDYSKINLVLEQSLKRDLGQAAGNLQRMIKTCKVR